MPIRFKERDQGRKVEFEGSRGARLAARLDLPPGAPRAYAVFAHCFTCSKDVAAAAGVARALTAEGIAVLRFDFTGLGHSGGEFANTDFSSNVDDLVHAARFLAERYEPPQLLVGHSLGGAAALRAAGRIPSLRAVATLSAPADPGHVRRLLGPGADLAESRGEAQVEIAGRSFRIRREFLEDLESHPLEEELPRLGKALLVLHAPADNVVGIENASRIFLAARHPKSFVSLDDADHLLTRPADAAYAARVIASWASRYLAAAPEAPEVPEGEVRVAEEGGGRFLQTIHAGRHVLAADEPRSAGGDDAGPTPYGLLLAALGACTTMTLRMYADRKELPLARASVRLRHDKIHAKDCEECETREGRIDLIEREIVLEGELDDDQRARLLEIADRCPVHRTLHSEIVVRSRLAGP